MSVKENAAKNFTSRTSLCDSAFSDKKDKYKFIIRTLQVKYDCTLSPGELTGHLDNLQANLVSLWLLKTGAWTVTSGIRH